MSHRPIVGIFQANWPLQVHTTNAINVLIPKGYDVDLFLYQVTTEFENPKNFDNSVLEHLRVIDFSQSNTNILLERSNTITRNKLKETLNRSPWINKLFNAANGYRLKLVELTYRFLQLDHLPILPRSLFDRTRKYMEGRTYKCLIGVEKHGLIWAGSMAKNNRTPLIYWSLDLYLNAVPRFNGPIWFLILKHLEQKFHHQSRATVIQDEARGRVLLEDNGIRKTELLYVPAAVLGKPATTKSDFLHQMLDIPPDNKIILSFGQIARDRYIDEQVRLAQSFPDDWTLVVHGSCNENEFLNELNQLNVHKRAILSTALVPASQVGELIASAAIGLVFYSNKDLDNLLTGKASEKAALFARAGVPIISFAYPSFKDIFDAYQCGRPVSKFEEVNEQILTILNNYQKYQEGASRAYREIYEFSNQFEKVVSWIANC